MTFLRVMAFSIAVLLSYTLFANILPQVQSNPPTQEEAPIGAIDMVGMIAFGERLFTGKGNCKLCHNDLGRAPDLLKLDLASTFAKRLGDTRYNGRAKGETGAKAIEVYLRESLIEPSAYVVAGFGKKGTGDKVSPMPKADVAPVELNSVQIDALIAFLQDKAGLQPTVSLPSTAESTTKSPAAGGSADTDEKEDGPAATPAAALEKFGCTACHDLEGSQADAGPKLNGIAKKMSREKIIEAIVNPNADIAEGYEADMMPLDFGEQMRVSELKLIVDYLVKLED